MSLWLYEEETFGVLLRPHRVAQVAIADELRATRLDQVAQFYVIDDEVVVIDPTA